MKGALNARVARLVTRLALLAWVAVSHALAQPVVVNEWLKTNVETLKSWHVEGDADDPLKANIAAKRPSSGKATQHVLVLYPRASSAYDVALARLLDVFNERDIDAKFTLLNFQNDPSLGMQAIAFAKSAHVDLIFTMGSESTDFMVARYTDGHIPVVSICSKDPVLLGQMKDYDKGSGTNFAFTSLNMQIDVQLAYLQELKPRLKHIGILVDSKNKSAIQTQSEPIARAARGKGINPIDIVVDDPANAAAELRRKIPIAIEAMRKTDPDLSNSVLWVTGSTSVFKEIASINRVAGKLPVISVVPEVATEGDDSAVLSIGISFDSNAYLAALYGADVLTGKAQPGSLKVGIVSPPDIAINFRKARQIGLKIPFSFFERAGFIYDYDGRPVRLKGISQLGSK